MAKPLSQERRAALIASSRKAAAALLDDIAYLREVIEKPTDAAEVRRLSSVLRRLLIVTGMSGPPRADLGSERYWRLFADFGRRLGGNFHA
jgi:hypothetical protein